ncbi:MAG: hypothetical protein SGBAC_001586 [Bacillariaceae sp.]
MLRTGYFRQVILLYILVLSKAFVSPKGRSLTFGESRILLQSSLSTTDDDVYTVQILMSDTGGGHRASANALRDALDVLHPGKFECDIVDIYTEYGPFFPLNSYPAMYKIMAEYSFLWEYFYNFGETEFGLWLNEFLLDAFCFEPFKECLNRPSGSTNKRADMVVSVHPLCQDTPLKILASLDSDGKSRDLGARKTPFVTVVTDLGGAHKTWFNKYADKCFVPSDALSEKAASRGLKEDQIIQHGLPIRKGFWSVGGNATKSSSKPSGLLGFLSKKSKENVSQLTEKENVRQYLGLDTDLATVLLVGGGDGMGGIVDIAEALATALGKSSDVVSYQMVIVCGSNEKAKQRLSGKNYGVGVKVAVEGYVNNMDEWMNAADALVTKAGPGTIAEASICGLPCMLFAYLPGQEEGNVPYVESNGFGKYSSDPILIAETVSSWLATPEKMESMQQAARNASRPSATLDIAKDLAQIAFDTRQD